MRKKFVWEWDMLDKHTRRAKVMGGWILHVSNGKSESMVFIADRDHEWHVMKPQAPLNEDKAP